MNFRSTLALLLLIFSIVNCHSDLGWKVVEKYPSGEVKAMEYWTAPDELIFRKDFFKNGILKMEYSVLQNEIEGDYRAYHENGILRTVAYLKNGCRYGTQKDFHDDGSLEVLTNFKDCKINGYQYFYNKDSTLRTVFYKVKDIVIYEKRFEGEVFTENYFPIISTSPEIKYFRDTVTIYFEMPLPKDLADHNVLSLDFTIVGKNNSDTITSIDPESLMHVDLVDLKGESQVILLDTGRYEIVGYVNPDNDLGGKSSEFFNKEFYITPKE